MEQENNSQLNQIAESLQEIASYIKRDPQSERYHSETHCPSCGRFVGTETRCPYCQTETQKRLSIRVFKVISVLISTLGLVMLLYYARGVETKAVKITDLGPLTNFAHVRIIGYADKDATVSKWGTLSITINQYYDKDGKLCYDRENFKNCEKQQIRATAYKKVAENINPDDLPRQGEEVDVEGQVRVQQGDASLLINAPEHIRYTPMVDTATNKRVSFGANPFKKANQMPKVVGVKMIAISPEKVTKEMLGKNVRIQGAVKTTQLLENDCVAIRLDNGTENGLPIFVPAFSQKKMVLPQIGAKVDVYGKVELYENELEVSIKKGYEFIKLLPQK